MPRPDQNAYVEGLFGIKLDHYDTRKLHDRYQIIAERVAKELHEGNSETAPRIYVLQRMKFNMASRRSPIVDAAFTELERASDLAVQSAKLAEINMHLAGLEDRAMQMFQERARRESHGPTVMDSAVVAGDMTAKQVKHFAEAAQKAWEDFQNAHTTLFAIVDSLNQTYKDIQPIRDLIKLGQDYMAFARRLPVEQAAAAASGALGPIGPIAGTLAIIAELYGLFAQFLLVLGHLIDLLTKLAGGKGQVSESLKNVEVVIQKLSDVRKAMLAIRDRCNALVKPSAAVRKLLGKS